MTLYNSYTDVTNSIGDSPYIFHNWDIPADTLVTNGDKVCAEYFFTTAGTGASLEVYVAYEYVTVVPVVSDMPKDIKLRIIRTSSTSIRILLTSSDIAIQPGVTCVHDITGLDLENNAVPLIIQGMDSSLDPDVVVCKYAYGEYKAV